MAEHADEFTRVKYGPSGYVASGAQLKQKVHSGPIDSENSRPLCGGKNHEKGSMPNASPITLKGDGIRRPGFHGALFGAGTGFRFFPNPGAGFSFGGPKGRGAGFGAGFRGAGLGAGAGLRRPGAPRFGRPGLRRAGGARFGGFVGAGLGFGLAPADDPPGYELTICVSLVLLPLPESNRWPDLHQPATFGTF